MTESEMYIGRQPILNAHQEIYAYELLFRSSQQNAAGNLPSDLTATARVLVNTLNNVGVNKLLGDRFGFVNINDQILKMELHRSLPKKQFVLELLETTEITQEITELLRGLREEGYTFALDDFVFDEDFVKRFRPVFDLVSYIKVDVKLNQPETTFHKIKMFKDYKVKLLAEKVENMEEFNFYKKMGFELFQGYFFEKPTIIRGRNIDPQKSAIMQLISLIQKDPDITKIESVFKMYPDLTINLLKFINSAQNYLRSRITSVRQAIAMIGYRKLLNWLLLLAYANPGQRNTLNPLFITASQRGKVMELLLQSIRRNVEANEKDEAFLVGLLSLLDALFQVPMADILGELNMSQEIQDAIMTRTGALGRILNLVQKTEENVQDEILPLLAELDLTFADLNRCMMEGFAWTDQMYSGEDA
jgi:EAL and modified HD-GYP domain-containing signal transduction protein